MRNEWQSADVGKRTWKNRSPCEDAEHGNAGRGVVKMCRSLHQESKLSPQKPTTRLGGIEATSNRNYKCTADNIQETQMHTKNPSMLEAERAGFGRLKIRPRHNPTMAVHVRAPNVAFNDGPGAYRGCSNPTPGRGARNIACRRRENVLDAQEGAKPMKSKQGETCENGGGWRNCVR